MNKQLASNLLIQSSRSRKVHATLPPNRIQQIELGHLLEYQSEDTHWHGIVPGRQKWQATYQTEAIELPRPAQGTATVDLTCSLCGASVTVLVRSRTARRNYYAVLGLAIVLGAITAFALFPDALFALFGGVMAYYLFSLPEFVSGADHHSAMQLIQESQPGHRLWCTNPQNGQK